MKALERDEMATHPETQRIASAWWRLESILRRRPGAGMVQDESVVARWLGGTRIAIESAKLAQSGRVVTDVPETLGGASEGVSPGWLLRASLATCMATRVALGAAAADLQLTDLEVICSSRSDVSGLLGLTDEASGEPVTPAPLDCRLLVRVRAVGAGAERLRELVAESQRFSPVSRALQDAVPVHVEFDAG